MKTPSPPSSEFRPEQNSEGVTSDRRKRQEIDGRLYSGSPPGKNIDSAPVDPPENGGTNAGLWSDVQTRGSDFPKQYRVLYRKAISGRSRRAAISAHCLMCMGYSVRQVRNCTAPACPLYPYRPGAKHSKRPVGKQ